jgi:hypothetical protein
MFSLLVAVLGLTPVAQGAKIIWVSDNVRYDFDANEPADAGFVNLLRAQGHDVDYKGEIWPYDPTDDDIALNPDWHYWWELDPNKVDELNAADLVIISRIASSGKYDDVDAETGFSEPDEWNAVTTPMISLNAHISRSSKWKWVNGNETYSKEVLADIVAPDHAVFDGVVIDPNGQALLLTDEYNVNVIGATDAGNGTLLAARASDGSVAIAAWEAGVEYYDGAGQIAGGARMFFAAGSGSKSPKDGIYNLTADGETAFLNAVNYMLTKNTKIIWVADNLRYDFDANEPADIGFVSLLRGQGYTVDYKGDYMPHEPGNDEASLNPEWQYWRELDPNKLAELEAADLIIIARDCASSKYDDTGEAGMWNGISTPIMMQGPHLARRLGKWGWFDSGSTTDKAPGPMTVLVPDHDIFTGIAIDADDQVIAVDQEPRMNFIKDLVGAGNGRVLAEHGEGYTWIAEWRTGVEFYDGSTTFAGGPRMWFGSAAGNKNEGIGVLEGSYNLSADGEVMFLIAVS